MQNNEQSGVITDKEIEKKNFLSWYCMYATNDDIDKANTINKPAMDRLINEYSYEIERVSISRNLREELF
ncbi:hypothetical protein SCALIN_C05_0106 [Candidatus Scalindua japonica]|uniref:Uncharacterized protein n=1 Tax=Candidatus Scalindua japonica TaxID=1284222 RepID=A0A286TW22_9BACT|nr:hypothetical protein [Candidatus Scalindua japonica]GAX60021.1 hypothetical protein SCALIN_C05_0106 [Candidatus Scalindua japonica]